MTNDEARMTKEARMTNAEIFAHRIHSAFGFRHSFVIRASSFVISQGHLSRQFLHESAAMTASAISTVDALPPKSGVRIFASFNTRAMAV